MSLTIPVARAHRVTVNGIVRDALDASCTVGERAFVATASITLRKDEGTPMAGQRVEYRAGDAASPIPQFSGAIDANGIALSPNTLTIQCSGFLAKAQKATGHQDTTAPQNQGTVLDATGAIILYPQYYAMNKTDGVIVTELLALSGIAEVNIRDSGLVLGTIEPVILGYEEPPWRLIADIDRLTGYRTFDGPDGVVYRIPSSALPAPTPALTLDEAVQLMGESAAQRSRSELRNRIVLTGLPQLGSTSLPFTPTGIAYADAPVDPATGRPVVDDPPRYQTEPWSTTLAETGDVCEAYARRRLGELNRIAETVPLAIAGGEPRARAGMTIALGAPHLDYPAGTVAHVEQVRQHSDARGLTTTIDAVAITRPTGFSPNVAPIAVIALDAETETLADGSSITIVQADGSSSYDPDGEIVSYNWNSSSPAPVAVGAEGKTATFVYTGGGEGSVITLIVTDNLGKTGTTSRTFSQATTPTLTRDLYSAENVRWQHQRDGVWVDILAGGVPVEAVGTAEIAESAPYTLGFTAAGALYKADASDLATLVPEVTSVSAVWLTESLNGVKAKDRAWAGCSDGRVWFSQGAGDPGTWAQVARLPNNGRCEAILESPFRDGDVYATANNILYHSYDRGASWQALRTHPNAALIGSRIAAGFGKRFAAFRGAGGDDAGVARVVESQNAAIGDFPAPAKPVNVLGLTYALLKDMLYAVDRDSAGTTGRAWRADVSTSSFNWEQRTYATGTLGVPSHAIRDGRYELVYGAADRTIWKALNDLGTYYVLKDLPGGVSGRMVGYGQLRARAVAVGQLVASAWLAPNGTPLVQNATAHKIVQRNQTTGRWSVLSTHPVAIATEAAIKGYNLGSLNPAVTRPLLRLASGVYLTWAYASGNVNSGCAAGVTNAYRSTDGCQTWAALGIQGVVDIAQAIDGAVYALSANGTVVSKSTDDGATWAATAIPAPAGVIGTADTGRWIGVSCSPVDASKGALRGPAGVAFASGSFAVASALTGPGDLTNYPGDVGVALVPSGAGAVYDRAPGTQHVQRAPLSGASVDVTPAGATLLTPNEAPRFRRLGTALFPINLSPQGTGDQGGWRSTDDGFSFARFFADANRPLAGPSGHAYIRDVGQRADGTLVVAVGDPRSTGGGDNSPYCTFAQPGANPAGPWDNLSTTQVADLGGCYACHAGGLVVT